MAGRGYSGGLITPLVPVTEANVESHSRYGKHKVNLADYVVDKIPNGSCTCEHFTMSCLPRLRARREVVDSDDSKETTRCKHIRQHREWLTNQIIKKIGKEEEKL